MKKLISMLFMAVLAVVAMTGCDDEETVLQKYTVTFNSQGGRSCVRRRKNRKAGKPDKGKRVLCGLV